MIKHVISFLGIALSHCQQRGVHFVTICVSQKGNDWEMTFAKNILHMSFNSESAVKDDR
jgi:hypothetical protein